MDIAARRNKKGVFQLEMGPVTFSMNEEGLNALHQVINQRLHSANDVDAQNLERKLEAYKVLAGKMSGVDDRIIQKFAPQVTPEQLVTITRLSEGDELYEKLIRNLSTQNRRQFEEDYERLNKITKHNACIYMEQLVPLIKQAAMDQKKIQNEMMGR